MSCCVSYLTLLIANIKNRKKLQLIQTRFQTIWDVGLYSQHFAFHWKLLVLVSRIEKYVLGTTILANGKGHFGPTERNDQTGHSGPPSKLVPNIPVGPNRNGPFHLMNQPKFPDFWVKWKALIVSNGLWTVYTLLYCICYPSSVSDFTEAKEVWHWCWWEQV